MVGRKWSNGITSLKLFKKKQTPSGLHLTVHKCRSDKWVPYFYFSGQNISAVGKNITSVHRLAAKWIRDLPSFSLAKSNERLTLSSVVNCFRSSSSKSGRSLITDEWSGVIPAYLIKKTHQIVTPFTLWYNIMSLHSITLKWASVKPHFFKMTWFSLLQVYVTNKWWMTLSIKQVNLNKYLTRKLSV